MSGIFYRNILKCKIRNNKYGPILKIATEELNINPSILTKYANNEMNMTSYEINQVNRLRNHKLIVNNEIGKEDIKYIYKNN